MPNWSGTVLTNKGLALQAKVEAGATMNITKLKIGDGVLGVGQQVATLNDLVSPQKIIDISALTPLEGGTCKIHGIVTNAGIETGFYVRELGIFAQDPDIGEILYAYTADGSPDFLPPEGGPVAVSEELVINLAFSSAANITANINMDGLVTVAVMQNAVNVHNTDPDAHNLPDLLHLRQNSTAYDVGDIAYSLTLPSYAYAECIQAGTTAATEPEWPAVGEDVVDGTVKWAVRDMRVSDAADDDSTKKVTTSWLRTNIQSLVTDCIEAVATAAGFVYSFEQNGYIKLPSWLGGLTLQWGERSFTGLSDAETFSVTFPITFPNECLSVILGSTSGTISTGSSIEGARVVSKTVANFTLTSDWASTNLSPYRYFAIGY